MNESVPPADGHLDPRAVSSIVVQDRAHSLAVLDQRGRRNQEVDAGGLVRLDHGLASTVTLIVFNAAPPPQK